MDWTELKQKIYYCDGSLRDIYILQTSNEDDKKWTDYVNKNYLIQWFNGIKQTNENIIDFEVVKGYLNGKHDLCSSASIFIDKIQINNHFFSDKEIENDIDPRDINNIQDHEKIIKYMSELSNLLDKTVILTPESEQETILIKVTKNKIEYLDNFECKN